MFVKMWNNLRQIQKLWVFYLFVMFFGTFVFLFASYLLVDQGTYFQQRSVVRSKQNRRKDDFNIIVGRYVGSGSMNDLLTKDAINENHFSPVAGEGENGKPIVVPAKDILKMQQLFQVNRFNLVASDRMSLNRSIPDVRKKKCVTKLYPDNLPTTSVIIVFHNEAWSVLLRTVWSVINRSPKHFLREILLIDDASDRQFLKTLLDEYVATLPVLVKVLRIKTRSGLVAARLLGSREAKGETLTFLDAHCECSPGWLEPLLARVKENRHSVVSPVIDIISDDNFGYIKSFEFHYGAFNWHLHFRWFTLSADQLQQRKTDVTEPFKTPAMAGGLFTIDKDYFFEVGSYDKDMKIWGGDNLEMSFRIWQCGGILEIAPCSHVGHLFRKSSPYTFPGGVNTILNTNLARLAMVWLDDWSNFFFKFNKIEKETLNTIDVAERDELRQNLKCENFNWYLKNIWPNHFWPSDDRFFGKLIITDPKSSLHRNYMKILNEFTSHSSNTSFQHFINFLNTQTIDKPSPISFCLGKPTRSGISSQSNQNSFLKVCNTFESTNLDELLVIKSTGAVMSDEGVCLDYDDYVLQKSDSVKAKFVNCVDTNRQQFVYNVHTQQMRAVDSKVCLTGSITLRHVLQNRVASAANDEFEVLVQNCDENNMLQKWILVPVKWKS